MYKILKILAVNILIFGMFVLGWQMGDRQYLQQTANFPSNSYITKLDISEDAKEYFSTAFERIFDINGMATQLFENAEAIKDFVIELLEKNISYLQNNILLIQ